MINNWILFAILAPIFFSISSTFDKYLVDRILEGAYDFLFYSLFLELIFSAIAYLFFDVRFESISLLLILAGIILVIAISLYIDALEVADVSVVAPLWGMEPIFLFLISYFIFGKLVTLTQFISFLIILLGSVIISIEYNSLRRITLNKAFVFMIAASLSYAILFALIDFALEYTNIETVIFFEGLGFAAGSIFLLFLKKSKDEVRMLLNSFNLRKFLLFLGSAGADQLGMIVTYRAFSLAPNPALVSVIGGAQSFFTLVWATILGTFFPGTIKERTGKRILMQKILGMGIIFLGIYLMNFG